ncbi:MAG: hypothetical protein Q9170_003711 [Blastenia crenularia]
MASPETKPSGSKTYIELGWTGGHITFGSGYDVAAKSIQHRQLRSSALESFQLDPSVTGRKYMPNMHTITTSEELKSRIKADVSATVPLEGIAIESTSSYLRSVKTSDTSLVQVIEQIIQDDPVRANAYDLKLTAEAAELLGKDVRAFTDKFGEYFVYGHVSRARFTAVCNIKTSSKHVLEKIKSSLTAKAGDAKGISATLGTYNETSKESCTMDMNLEIDRLAGQIAESRPHFEIGELVKAYDVFQKDFKTTPYMALLCHYSVLDPRFPIPQNQFQYLGSKISAAYQSLYLAQNELSHSPMVQAAAFSAEIAKACDLIKFLDVNDEKAVANMHKSVQDCLDQVERWRLRFDLRSDAKKLEHNHLSESWISSGDQKEWSSGKLGVKGDPKYAGLDPDVKHRRETFQRDWKASRQYQTYDLGESQDLVIGYRVVNEWNNNENGWFKKHHGDICNSTSVKVEFCAETWRGCSWSVDVWTVPKILYETKPAAV